jgi:non-ribosomal peptide synthetase-like protein
MRVGRRCEISTITEVTPELVDIADDCFFADGIYLGRPLVHRGHVVCERTTFGARTFLGNHVVVPAGAKLPGDLLIGVCTVADADRARPGSGWFGHPAFELPRRERVEVDDRMTFRPSAVRYANRVFWESLRLTLPVLPVLVLAGWAVALPGLEAGRSNTAFHLGLLPLAALVTAVGLCLLTWVAKWVLVGRMHEDRHVLWSCWCSRWDFLFEIWSAYARPVIDFLEGTPFVAPWLRAMGARVGRRVVFGANMSQLVDPDLFEIDDDATFSGHLQLHSFEDRVLKLAPSRVGAGSTVASGALLFYGARIGERARVAEGGVVMKHEHLLPGLDHVGAPTRPVAEAPP